MKGSNPPAWGSDLPKFAGKWSSARPAYKPQNPVKSQAFQGELKPAKGKFVSGMGARRDTPKYTGSEMLGVSVLHKSNGIPVFSKEAIIDVSKMRRG